MAFGHAAAPLLWRRLAAALTRLAQALLPPSRGRLQTYLDDPLLVLRGTQPERDGHLAMVLLVWASLGAGLSWGKGARGDRVVWIGVQIEWSWEEAIFSIPAQKVKELAAELQDIPRSSVAPLTAIRRVGGRNAWATTLLRRARWWLYLQPHLAWTRGGVTFQSYGMRASRRCVEHHPKPCVGA